MAMQLAVLRRPDVVLLDVSKPEFAPEALATGLRIHYGPNLPILATSTASQPEIVGRIGAYEFLQKPFDMDHLFTLLARGVTLSDRSARLRAHSEQARDRLRHLRLIDSPEG